MTKHNFLNGMCAVDMLNSMSHTTAYGVLYLIHQGIQDCSGSPVKSISCVRLPTHALDLLWFYRTVEPIILNWEQISGRGETNSTETEKILNDPFLPKLDPEKQAALRSFASSFVGMPRAVPVDDSFCCWLFAETILVRDLLSTALDGSLSDHIRKELSADFETWAATWT